MSPMDGRLVHIIRWSPHLSLYGPISGLGVLSKAVSDFTALGGIAQGQDVSRLREKTGREKICRGLVENRLSKRFLSPAGSQDWLAETRVSFG